MKVIDVERIVVDVPFVPRQHKITRNSLSSVYNWSVLELCKSQRTRDTSGGARQLFATLTAG